jgi:hypothetical protein
MPTIPDLVRDSKLETGFYGECTQHVYHVSGATPRQRKVTKEERWARDKRLGTGASATVYLEKSITENGEVQHRAVKEIRKSAHESGAIDYGRELEAIAKFSHPKVRDLSIFNSHFLFGSTASLTLLSHQKLTRKIV